MISTANITMQFGAKPLFENVSVKFNNGNRYGLIGANGSGKSTFMKILGGELEPSGGQVMLEQNVRLGKLRQDQFAYEEFSVIDTVIMGHEELWKVKAERDEWHAVEPAPADVEDERIGAWHRVAGHPFFRGCYAQERPLIDAMLDLLTLAATSAETVHSHGPAQGQGRDCSERTDGHGHMRGMCMASAQADEDSDAVTISLPRDDLTKPAVLRLAAADLRRKYHLGMGGLPRSLPGTLDALADGLDALLNPPTEGTDR